MKILAVIDGLRFGGAENVLATFGRFGPKHDVEVEIVSLSPAEGPEAAWLPVLREAGLQPRFLGIRRLAQADAIPRLAAAIRDSAPDIVHAHLQDSATLAPLACWLTGPPCVSTYHHVPRPLAGRERLRERLSVAAANRGSRVLFVSQASLDGFAAAYGGPRSHWTVVHNGIDLDRFRPEPGPLPADIAVPADAPVVTVIGRLGTGKGQANAIAAWPAVVAAIPDARLLLVGDGPLDAELRAQTQSLGVMDSVIFAGRRSDVERILATSTLTCLPTIREALPTALIEAAACGIPAVATEGSGVAEVVEDGVTGLLVPYADHRRLADALIELLRDTTRRTAMGAAARRLAEARFDAHEWVEQLRSVYSDAIAAGSVRRRRRRQA
jgi:glycosyltransferase involved in cell wall biosynthesis